MKVFFCRNLNLSALLSSIVWLSCSSEEIIVHDLPDVSENTVENDQVPQKKNTKKVRHEPEFPIAPVPEPSPEPIPPVVPPPVPVVPLIAVCGDTIISPNEECDDGNEHSGDGCSKECDKEICGDGIVNNVNETCDDKNSEDGNEYLPLLSRGSFSFICLKFYINKLKCS